VSSRSLENDNPFVRADCEAFLVNSALYRDEDAFSFLRIFHQRFISDFLTTKRDIITNPFGADFTPCFDFFGQFTLETFIEQ
jgi:hypothetical protein